jgi:hypothetical protein
MHVLSAISIAAVGLVSIFLGACGANQPIPGKYEFRNGPTAILELFANGSYRLCAGDRPCDTGTYDIETPRAFADGTYRLCNSEGCGTPFGRDRLDNMPTRLYFDGATRGPMKRFLFPPDGIVLNGLGDEYRYSQATTVEFNVWGQPGFTFGDPDSGQYFRRVADRRIDLLLYYAASLACPGGLWPSGPSCG